MIVNLSFEEIYPFWKNYLWSDRISKIETHSAMLFLSGFDLKNFNYKPSFFGYTINNQIVGVNSGHYCLDDSYRSRGLFVLKEYRKQGIGVKLLTRTIEQGKHENAKLVWSLPRLDSWKTYEAAGFNLVSDWHKTETSTNAYCRINI